MKACPHLACLIWSRATVLWDETHREKETECRSDCGKGVQTQRCWRQAEEMETECSNCHSSPRLVTERYEAKAVETEKLKGVIEIEELLVWHGAFSFRGSFLWWVMLAVWGQLYSLHRVVISAKENVLYLHRHCCGRCCCCYCSVLQFIALLHCPRWFRFRPFFVSVCSK